MKLASNPKIVVVGLGYVGLPLAIRLAEFYPTIGLDIDKSRIDELRRGADRTNEVEPSRLATTTLQLTAEAADVRGADVYIVTVPTPVHPDHRPDLRLIIAATRTVAAAIDLERPAIVVYESTVYPGVTEDICGELLQEAGLRRGEHFWLGYSPERINPGDREHTVDRITKVIAGENAKVTDALTSIYSKVTTGGVFRAASIRAAEGAKVIENAQRDINIAFMNEIAQIFSKAGLSIWDVLAAARTKWNFLPFEPGLVGGHCIGVDPYYLSYLAQQLGQEPRVILSGRAINDGMGGWIAEQLHAERAAPGRALVLGLTFKENVPDLRNSRVIDIIRGLSERGHEVTVYDPLANAPEAQAEYQVALDPDALARAYDLVICAVAHDEFRSLDDASIEALLAPGATLADLKGTWRDRQLNDDIRRWSL